MKDTLFSDVWIFLVHILSVESAGERKCHEMDVPLTGHRFVPFRPIWPQLCE